MFTRPFGYQRAAGFADACDLLREHGEGAKLIAGGQSLLPMVNLGLVQPDVVIDISHVAGGRELAAAGGYLTVGALATHAVLAADPLARQVQPLLGAAAARIGNARVRHRGTLGGTLAHSDPAAELPLVMVALGATYTVSNGRATRIVKAEDFHVTFLTSGLDADELVTSASLPVLGPGWGWSFQEVSRRDGDFALAAVAALVRIAGGMIVESRVAAGGVSDRPVRLADVETALSGASPGQIGERVGPLRGISPVTDAGASARHRAHLCRVLVLRALQEASRRSVAAA
ncbi:MAG TPA: FAD binding domain-containing protein [Streptosporangiaceae bacterium]|nr:FAD binding domain-containing protein [Streptosporangiaceae bacterium]